MCWWWRPEHKFGAETPPASLTLRLLSLPLSFLFFSLSLSFSLSFSFVFSHILRSLSFRLEGKQVTGKRDFSLPSLPSLLSSVTVCVQSVEHRPGLSHTLRREREEKRNHHLLLPFVKERQEFSSQILPLVVSTFLFILKFFTRKRHSFDSLILFFIHSLTTNQRRTVLILISSNRFFSPESEENFQLKTFHFFFVCDIYI